MKKLTYLMLGIFLITTSCAKDNIDQEYERNLELNIAKENQNDNCNDCDGKIDQLVLQFNGNETAEIIVETKKAGENGSKIVFSDFVGPGDIFSFFGNDKKGTLGTEIFIYINGEFNTKLHTSCSIPVGPGLVFGSFEVIDGNSRNGGELCPVEPFLIADDCNDCDGKIDYMELLYNGSDGATILVETKKVGENGSKTVFNQFVEADSTFEFSGNDKKGTLGTEISIYINGELNAKLHTSCSVPVGPGLIFGNFEVIRATSRNGGELCPLETDSPDDGCPCVGNIIQMILIYDGPSNATVSVGTQSDGSEALQVFNNVQSGDILNISMGYIGDWWYYSVNGNVDASINTSCSDIILGNIDATISDFGSLGSGAYSNPSQNSNDATFYIYSHTDSDGNTCTANLG